MQKDVGGVAMRVLVAIDGSAPADIAVDLVASAPWPTGSEILVVESIESGAALYGGPWPTLALAEADQLEAEMREEAERCVHDAAGRLAGTGRRVEAEVLRGRPATAIVERARETGADLVVVGSRGHGRIESMLLGSVSAELVDHAPTPVLVARRPRIGRVLLAWDGSTCASLAADLLRAWPIFGSCKVHVLSVADIEVPWWTGFPEPGSAELMPMYVQAAEASRFEHDQLAGGMAAKLGAAGLDVDAGRREGDAATEILAAARAWDADLIVMGTHGRTGLARLVIGSVARNILQHATCSVLVVREGAARAGHTRTVGQGSIGRDAG
jgi:nucleotide-binding universal stress UspA family protein